MHEKKPQPTPKENQFASIVSIVGGMVIRESFALGGKGRRGFLGRWKTRTGTALFVVCLSLVLCLGVRVLCIRSHLGEIGVFLPEMLRVSAFGVVVMIGLVPLVVVHVMGMLSLVAVCLLNVLHLVINTSLGEVATLSLRGTTDHVFPFMVLVLLQ
jgi:predicted small integral membrane protein